MKAIMSIVKKTAGAGTPTVLAITSFASKANSIRSSKPSICLQARAVYFFFVKVNDKAMIATINVENEIISCNACSIVISYTPSLPLRK